MFSRRNSRAKSKQEEKILEEIRQMEQEVKDLNEKKTLTGALKDSGKIAEGVLEKHFGSSSSTITLKSSPRWRRATAITT